MVFNAAKAGVRIIDTQAIGKARRLLIAADANAVPPSGIEGVAAKDNGVELKTANGTAREPIDLPSGIAATPIIVNGTLYLVTEDATLYAYR